MEKGSKLGDWTCEKILGRGSFGTILLFNNSTTHFKIAVKKFEVNCIDFNDSDVLSKKENWKKEVELMYDLINSPYIVSTIPVPDELKNYAGYDQNLPLISMEFCSGGDLRQFLKKPENICGLKENDVRDILLHISNAINYLHERNIIHRDLKPENILIQHHAQKRNSYKLADLGFAKDLKNNSNCSTFVGTIQYLAPEICKAKKYDKTADYWSFGLIAFEIICGMRPFLHGDSPTQWLPLVENKPTDVICIYKKEDGICEFSNKIPFVTHLAGLFKICIEKWLQMVLQFDSSSREKKINGDKIVHSMTLLNDILNTKFLYLESYPKTLIIAIGKSSSLEKFRPHILRDAGLDLEELIILTSEGHRVQPDELLFNYLDKTTLFIVPQNVYVKKIKVPKILNEFLKNPDILTKDAFQAKLIWTGAVYFAQIDLSKIQHLNQILNALEHNYKHTYGAELKKLKKELEKKLATLGVLVDFEKKLEEFDRKFDAEFDSNSGLENLVNERNGIEEHYYSSYADEDEEINIGVVELQEMEKLYQNILAAYEEWKNPQSASTANKQKKILYQSICGLLELREPIVGKVLQNIKFRVEKMGADARIIEKLKSIIEQIEASTNTVKSKRYKRQTFLLRSLYGNPSGIVGGSPTIEYSSSPEVGWDYLDDFQN